jgi:two-component system C4-dicarboxylate transport sensor histidine kinase DctB
MRRLHWIIRAVLVLALVALAGGGSWWFAYRDALDRLQERGQADLAWAADRLTAQLFRHRELAVVLARHPDLKAALEGSETEGAEAEVVRAMADMTGADRIALVDTQGRLRVASRSTGVDGEPVAPSALARAFSGALGTAQAIGTDPNRRAARRVFVFAAPVFADTGQVTGAVVVEANVRGIEENWPGNAPAVYFSDASGRIIASDRPDLVLANLTTGAGFPAHEVRIVAGHEIWRLDFGPYLPAQALHLARALPALGVRADILVSTADARGSAALQGMLAAAIAAVFAVVVELVMHSRRGLALRLKAEAEINARLEERVAERTRTLSETNLSLTREVSERREAEAALKRAQGELVQASKLAALGKMSAGISHELNQPLMAIRTFAENAAMFLDRDRPGEARDNVTRIAELARRMGRIIQNLRAFARQENGPVSDVDLAAVVEMALETGAEKIARHDVTLDWVAPEAPVWVRGGEVRLGQVVVNLISNAVDAMAETDGEKRLSLAIDADTRAVRLSVRDTGPGIEDPERVFDPFYTTKKIGAAEGMGLGLSISYGLVQGFGGTIRGANRPEGGAEFTVELAPARGEVAA